MEIGIDASNLNLGGGKTHIINFLNSIDWNKYPEDRIILYAKESLLGLIVDDPHIVKKTNKYINGNLFSRYYWYLFNFKDSFEGIDILFAPGGLYSGNFHPFVSMSRNMLLFDKNERKRVGLKLRLKLELSRLLQVKSLKKADGVIFLSDYAQETISRELNLEGKCIQRIPHGISSNFRIAPEERSFVQKQSYNLLYVSHIYEYKHPWNLVYAAAKLREKGYDIHVKIVGGGDPNAILKLKTCITTTTDATSYIEYCGNQTYDKIHLFYKEADIFVYPSTCENMPNILIEAMSSSLPIVCSDYPPMPEFMRDAGVLCDPLNVDAIADAIEKLLGSNTLRKELSVKSFNYSLEYDWKCTAMKTMDFIQDVYNKFKQ